MIHEHADVQDVESEGSGPQTDASCVVGVIKDVPLR